MKIVMWLLLRPSWGNPQYSSTFGIIFQVHHCQQITTMVTMSKMKLWREKPQVLGDFSANLKCHVRENQFSGNIVSLWIIGFNIISSRHVWRTCLLILVYVFLVYSLNPFTFNSQSIHMYCSQIRVLFKNEVSYNQYYFITFVID